MRGRGHLIAGECALLGWQVRERERERESQRESERERERLIDNQIET